VSWFFAQEACSFFHKAFAFFNYHSVDVHGVWVVDRSFKVPFLLVSFFVGVRLVSFLWFLSEEFSGPSSVQIVLYCFLVPSLDSFRDVFGVKDL